MKFACVFPGQGAQSVGMLAELIADAPEMSETLAEASDALSEDLAQLASEGPMEKLSQTRNTQPVLLAMEVGLWRTWCARGGTMPSFLAGHSFGEYAAWVASGALSLADATSLARLRGELMQGAVPEGEGGMAAILGLEDEQVEKICAERSRPDAQVQVANYNCPGQVVLSGHRAAVQETGNACKEKGARRVLELAVSVPAHSALMRGIGASFREALDAVSFRAPDLPVVNNTDTRVEQEPGRIRDALEKQLYSPVRWSRGVQWMAQQDVGTIIEMGPGKILSGLNRRIDRNLRSFCIETPQTLETALAEVHDGE